MPADSDDTSQALLEDLRSTVGFLERCGEQHWAAWLARDAERIRGGDVEGLRHLLSAYGGMGSINDLQIDPFNGHSISEEDALRANKELRGLLTNIWQAATELSSQLRDH